MSFSSAGAFVGVVALVALSGSNQAWADGKKLRRIDSLLPAAARAARSAHAPYSKVRLGAALQLRRPGILGRLPWIGKRTVTGFNSESHGDLQICAEAAGIARLPRNEARRAPVEKLAVYTDGNTLPLPCGRCLQLLCEVGKPSTKVIVANARGEHRRYSLEDLVPTSFETSTPAKLKSHRPLIAQAVNAYRRSRQAHVSKYRPSFGAAVRTDAGDVFLGMVIKNTASTFTPATQPPLDRVSQIAALRSHPLKVDMVVIAGKGTNGSSLPMPTADERQHIVDMNPQATVVLYNPHARTGAVIKAQQLLPHAYDRHR